MTTRIQPANAPPPGLAPKPTRRTSGTPVPMDIVDPMVVLADKGINQKNRTDIGALAGVIESFGNFRKSDGKLGTTAKNSNPGITKANLQDAVADIKAPMSTPNIQPSTTYAQALSGPRPTTTDPQTLLKTEIKDKKILISTRNVPPGSNLITQTTENPSNPSKKPTTPPIQKQKKTQKTRQNLTRV
ncbi:hypothetical protein M422DRAFT_263487 [Sphaerobolus stellatus SS14]|uniref:Uncharacterized protein n=1 Tax=Sphaerobolus stellatus (strain SS14) TaxID=990650 RepID=A0A0C9UHN7_SPHS4|nr:hypothetical protein M422DRAFT_263487 [Sphaerobolus stellatus SS14]